MNNHLIKKAAEEIQQGHLVAFPTETVYGLGADATNTHAINKIFKAKDRPASNPLIVHVASEEHVALTTQNNNTLEKELMRMFWPGPLTLVLERNSSFPNAACAGQDTIAIRWPASPTFQQLIQYADKPIAAPSANRSGKPSPTRFEDLDPLVLKHTSTAIDGGACTYGLESTVVRVVNEEVKILRPGALSAEDIRTKINAPVNHTHSSEETLSPGTRFKHYAPKTPLTLVRHDDWAATVAQMSEKKQNMAILCTQEQQQQLASLPDHVTVINLGSDQNLTDTATRLFQALHELDRIDVDFGLVHDFDESGLGHSIMDRLRKATES